MLTERKRFNYMANAGQYNSSNRKRVGSSALKPSVTVFQEECSQPMSQIHYREDKENQRRDLELANRKM